jgi:hypothetical protein
VVDLAVGSDAGTASRKEKSDQAKRVATAKLLFERFAVVTLSLAM